MNDRDKQVNYNLARGDIFNQSGNFGIGVNKGTVNNTGKFSGKFNEAESRNLAEAIVEIQQLLQQLEQSNPTATDAQKRAFVDAAIAPTKKERLISAVRGGGKAAIEEFLDNPYINTAIAIIEGWITPHTSPRNTSDYFSQ